MIRPDDDRNLTQKMDGVAGVAIHPALDDPRLVNANLTRYSHTQREESRSLPRDVRFYARCKFRGVALGPLEMPSILMDPPHGSKRGSINGGTPIYHPTS